MTTRTLKLSANAILERIDKILAELHDLRLTVQELAQVDAAQSTASRPDPRQSSETIRAVADAFWEMYPGTRQHAARVLGKSGKFHMPTQPLSVSSLLIVESPVPISGKPVSAIVLEQRGSYDPE